MSYNNNSSGEARQLLEYASNLNILNMSKDDFMIIGKGLMRTLEYELKVAESIRDEKRYTYAKNMIQNMNNLDINNISSEVVTGMVQELVNLLTRQIQEVNNNSTSNNNMFSNNTNIFSNNTNNAFSNNANNNQNNIAFSGNAFGSTPAAAQQQSVPSATFKGNLKQHSKEKVNIPQKQNVKKELTLEDIVNNYIPKKGYEFPPLYDDTVYKLWYQLDGNYFEYILLEL